ALAYAQERRAHYLAALRIYDEILRRAPGDGRAWAARILALSSLGADQAALREAGRYPRALDAAQWQRLHEDHAAALLRRAELASGPQARRFQEIDRVLARLDENLRRYPLSLRTRFDRVRALRDRYLMPQAVQAYRQLRRAGVDAPYYVHAAAGWAYLYLRQPERASRAFLLALKSKPDDRDARRGLFYAYSDLNDFTRARALIEDSARGPLTPDQELQARVYAAWERAFEGHLGAAQRRFERLWAQAPYNDEIEAALGTVYLWRGWPRRARAHYQAVIARAPDNLQARAGRAQAAMTLGDYRHARARIEALDRRHPLDADVRTLARAWRLHALRRLHVEAGYGKDLQGQQSSRDLRLASYLYAAPVDDTIRPFLHQYYERSDVNARRAAYHRLGAGAVYSAGTATRLSAEVRREFASGTMAGVAARFDHAFDDHWSLGAGLDTDSVDVPLAARAAGIDGRSLNLTADYRASERGGAGIALRRLRMSDGNRRTSVYLNAWRRVVNRPRYQGSVSGEVYASRNTRSDAPYYNPRRDASVSLGYKNDWLIYRRYGRALQHWLSVSAGVYAEAGFHTAWIGGLRYGQEWSVSDALGLTYSAGYLRRVYDGVAVYTPELRLGVDWRF
ncbi:MAG: poly-beta-1,6 N-acetyl-D-glucosamine export porin PgaA, partial [Gammaproteobacteria bacterium]|nr:poly-beta-1,6 N-acetyl-D-glucosamine export porin PgaA [Gammaproteobacteria bacterium]